MTGARAPRDIWIVARDRPDLYEQLKQRFRDDPGVEVVFDQRHDDRRAGGRQRLPDRRRTDRRGPSMEILGKLFLQGYAVVHVEERQSATPDAVPDTYRGFRVEPKSEQLASGAWSPKAVVTTASGGRVKITPIGADSTVTFGTREEADRYAMELAARWIGGGVRGGREPPSFEE